MLVHISLSNGHEYITELESPEETKFHDIGLRCSQTCRVFNFIKPGQHHLELMPIVDPAKSGLDDRPYRDKFMIFSGHVVTAVEVNDKAGLYREYQHVMGRKIITPAFGAKGN